MLNKVSFFPKGKPKTSKSRHILNLKELWDYGHQSKRQQKKYGELSKQLLGQL
jgi:hypothetical protein